MNSVAPAVAIVSLAPALPMVWVTPAPNATSPEAASMLLSILTFSNVPSWS